jgi:decaprenylphospho-beta-D-ribofuranose 2-oxidase
MQAARPERTGALLAAAGEDAPGGLLAAGAGRSYGDAGINAGGRIVLTERLDRMLAFDEATGLLVAEPGVSVAAVLACFLPRGWCLPVVPGTGSVTLGGAVASDVHGKNHLRAGSFGAHVAWLDLLGADGNLRRLSPQQDAERFEATLGGMGLTGIVTRVAVALRRVPSGMLAVRREKLAAPADLFARLAEVSAAAEFSVAWIDAQATGAAFGRGVVESADWSAAGTPSEARRGFAVPFTPPVPVVVPALLRPFNRRYWQNSVSAEQAAPSFFFPLDRIAGWNRLYGPRGFLQFQCLVPDAAALLPILQACTDVRPTLAVLKPMGNKGRGPMSFAGPGWALALDFANRPEAVALLNRLHAMTIEANGRVYLAKDATLLPEHLPRMYGELDRFRELLMRTDPAQRLQSSLSRRLQLR